MFKDLKYFIFENTYYQKNLYTSLCIKETAKKQQWILVIFWPSDSITLKTGMILSQKLMHGFRNTLEIIVCHHNSLCYPDMPFFQFFHARKCLWYDKSKLVVWTEAEMDRPGFKATYGLIQKTSFSRKAFRISLRQNGIQHGFVLEESGQAAFHTFHQL